MKPGVAALEPDLCLQAWLSPAFPIGAFAYSHGLEAAVERGDVSNASTLHLWLEDLLQHGAARSDAILVAAAWRAASGGAADALATINDLAVALAPSRERRLETVSTGNAFAAVIRSAWPDACCSNLPAGDLAYAIAFGSACATQQIALAESLRAFVLGFVQNLVSAAVRLGAMGQTDGQRVTVALIPQAGQLAAAAAASTLDDLGSCAQQSDIAAMRHETMYSRLFRS